VLDPWEAAWAAPWEPAYFPRPPAIAVPVLETKAGQFGNTQVDISDDSFAGAMLSELRAQIDPSDLAGKGLEPDAHVTIRFGLMDGADTVAEYFRSLSPFEITFRDVIAFDPTPNSEGTSPIVVRVDSPELERIHAELPEHGRFKAADFEYSPHATIAYVKPESAFKYAGDESMRGIPFEVTRLTISGKDRSKQSIKLGGEIIETKASAKLGSIWAAHGNWLDSLSSNFENELTPIVAEAMKKLEQWLKDNLTIASGKISRTAHNLAILRAVNDKLMVFLDEAGYNNLLHDFSDKLSGQLPFLQQTIDQIAKESGHQLPAVSFTPSDLQIMDGLNLTTQQSIRLSMRAAAGAAAQKILFSVNALPFKDLVETFKEEFGGSVGRNVSRANTAASVWYRSVSDVQYTEIEKNAPALKVAFTYSGPLDQKTRPFCRMMLARTADNPMTREQIDKLDNGFSGPGTVFTFCGGVNCRHNWNLALDRKAT
jgi:2'-5' RNA ligase